MEPSSAADDRRIDAVLTLTLADCDRAQILFRSLKLVQPLGVCWIVVPDAQISQIQKRVPAGPYRLIPESELLPELAFYRRLYQLHPRRTRRRLPGTMIHQLIKIGMAARVTTPFYLTLDADVFCLKPVSYNDLIRGGRAINRRIRETRHQDWYVAAERVLGLPRSRYEHGVTPAVISREAMLKLQDYLERNGSRSFQVVAGLLPRGSRLRNLLGTWRSYLIRNRPWTEYSLYMTFLEANGLYDIYHFDAGEEAVYSHCVWRPSAFETWDPARAVDVKDSYFCLVQSTTKIDPRRVAEKVAPFID